MVSEIQPGLWQSFDTSTGMLELFPEAWNAAEALCGPDARLRRQALARLDELGAARLSPLVVYLVAGRLTDPDLGVRCQAVRIAGDLLAQDKQGNLIPEPVRRYLVWTLSQMRMRSVFHLLEVAKEEPESTPQITRLLNACPYAGRHLADIALDRTFPLAERKQAVLFIGAVGYLDAIPPLERLASRLAARLKGQQTMSFAPPAQGDEDDLLPIVQSVLHLLHAP
jgi:hypothetical protein